MLHLILSPIVELAILGALSLLLRRVLHIEQLPAAAPAIVMAAGIAILGALEEMPFPDSTIIRVAALALVVIAGHLASIYVRDMRRGRWHPSRVLPQERFALGTWVAGLAVLAQVMLVAVPRWRPAAILVGACSVVLWLWFLSLALQGLRVVAADPVRHRASGILLLSTVSTQAIVLLAVSLEPRKIPHDLLLALVVLGLALYIFGAGVIVRRYLAGRNLTDEWDNTNVILHGALSITGLAATLAHAIPATLIAAIWFWALLTLVVVEVIELMRAMLRVRRYGWRRALFTYHVSQWARNFTLGMFYVFSLRVQIPGTFSWLRAVQAPIVAYGQYVVAALLVAETGILVWNYLPALRRSGPHPLPLPRR